jgi:transposase InsO family protein
VCAASSLLRPLAISRQNHRSTSRRCDGFPGDFITERPVNAFIQPAGLPIATPHIEVLRRPRESAQYTSFRYTQRLADLGIAASVGSVADAYDNAMAESFVGTLKTELVAGRIFPTRFDAEITAVEYLGWFNHSRLHASLGDVPPAEFEALYAPQFETITTPTTTKATN